MSRRWFSLVRCKRLLALAPLLTALLGSRGERVALGAPPGAPTASAEPAGSAPSAAPPLEVLVVGASQDRVPGSVHILRSAELQRFRYTDPGQLLLQAPGVYVRQEDGVGLRPNVAIRGGNSDRSKKLTLMEDGVLFGPAPYSAPAAYYFPLMARMTEVHVVKGPSAIAHGPQTVGGAVDFISRPIPEAPSGAADLTLGRFGFVQTHAHFGANTDDFGMLIEGVRLRHGGFKVLPDGADTGSTRNDWLVKTRYTPNPAAANLHEFQLKLSYADELSNETYLGLTDDDFRRDPDQRYAASALDQMKNHRIGMTLTHRLDLLEPRLDVVTDLYRFDYARTWRKVNAFRGAHLSDVLRNPEDPINAEYLAVLRGDADSAGGASTLMIGPNERVFVSQGVQTRTHWHVEVGGVGHVVEGSLRVHNDSITRRHSQTGFDMTDGHLLPAALPEDMNAANRAETTALALHVSDALSWGVMTVTPGVRVELIWSSFDDRLANAKQAGAVHAVMPGIGSYFALSDSLGALGGVYRGFSPPAPGSGEEARPEYSVNYEAGLRYSARPLRVEAIGFLNDYQNLTDVCTLSSGCLTEKLDRQFDAGKARVVGVEGHAAFEPKVGPVTLPMRLSYTHTRARFRNAFQSADPIYGTVRIGDYLPYVPRHQLTGAVGVEGARSGASLAGNYVSRMREEAGRGPLAQAWTTDEQMWLDAVVHYRPWPMSTFHGALRNLLDARYLVARRPYGARPNAPRWLQVGAEVTF